MIRYILCGCHWERGQGANEHSTYTHTAPCARHGRIRYCGKHEMLRRSSLSRAGSWILLSSGRTLRHHFPSSARVLCIACTPPHRQSAGNRHNTQRETCLRIDCFHCRNIFNITWEFMVVVGVVGAVFYVHERGRRIQFLARSHSRLLYVFNKMNFSSVGVMLLAVGGGCVCVCCVCLLALASISLLLIHFSSIWFFENRIRRTEGASSFPAPSCHSGVPLQSTQHACLPNTFWGARLRAVAYLL